jgi:hypothetical protein
MRALAISCLLSLSFLGCHQENRPYAEVVKSPDYLPALVGTYIEIDGTVSNSTVPQICGVDLWGLENFKGRRLRVRGTLQCTVVVRTDGDRARVVDSGRDGFVAPVFQKPGTYYRLQKISYEMH